MLKSAFVVTGNICWLPDLYTFTWQMLSRIFSYYYGNPAGKPRVIAWFSA
jgi:hypothetical protein